VVDHGASRHCLSISAEPMAETVVTVSTKCPLCDSVHYYHDGVFAFRFWEFDNEVDVMVSKARLGWVAGEVLRLWSAESLVPETQVTR